MRPRNYVLGIFLPLGLALLLNIFIAVNPGASELSPLVALFYLASAITSAVLVYRMWAAIRDEHTRPTPGMAVFGLLIPVFNLYWAFRVWVRWPVAYGPYARRAGKEVPPISRAPFTAMVVLSYLAPVAALLAIPFMETRRTQEIGLLLLLLATGAALTGLVLFFVVLGNVCAGVNRLADSPSGD